MQEAAQSAACPFPRRQPPAGGGRRAFTLIEILLVLALIGLLTSIFVVGVNRMLDPGPENGRQAFWHMATEARRYALQHESNVRVNYDETTNSLLANAEDGTVLEAVAVPEGTKLVFMPGLMKPTTTTTIGGGAILEDEPMPYVTFFSDGTCALFRVEVEGGTSAMEEVLVDPWTCSPMFKTGDSTNPGNI